MDIESLEVLMSFALAHGNINHIIDVIMALLGEWVWQRVWFIWWACWGRFDPTISTVLREPPTGVKDDAIATEDGVHSEGEAVQAW